MYRYFAQHLPGNERITEPVSPNCGSACSSESWPSWKGTLRQSQLVKRGIFGRRRFLASRSSVFSNGQLAIREPLRADGLALLPALRRPIFSHGDLTFFESFIFLSLLPHHLVLRSYATMTGRVRKPTARALDAAQSRLLESAAAADRKRPAPPPQSANSAAVKRKGRAVNAKGRKAVAQDQARASAQATEEAEESEEQQQDEEDEDDQPDLTLCKPSLLSGCCTKSD